MWHYAVALTLALVVVFGLGLMLRAPTEPQPEVNIDVTKVRFPEVATISGRTVINADVGEGGVVSYAYLDEPLPATFSSSELVELRTPNSYTEFKEVVQEGEDPILKLEARFYPKPQFAQDEQGVWRRIEYGTTTEEVLSNSMPVWTKLLGILAPVAYADSISPFSDAGDGIVNGYGSGSHGSNQTTCRSSALSLRGGSGFNYTANLQSIYHEVMTQPDEPSGWLCDAYSDRGFFPFDTSAMPSGSTVTATTFNLYIASTINNTNNGSDFLTILQTSQATHTSLVAADWDNVSTEGIDSGERKDITSISSSAYLTFTLNATGRGWVKASGASSNCSATAGISCLGVLEGNDFTANTGVNSGNTVNFYSSDQTGTSLDPYLSVTYTAPASSVVPPRGSIKLTSGGTLIVTSGGIKIQ